MTPADISIKTTDERVLAALARVRLALPLDGDSTPVMASLARLMKSQTQLRFRTQRGPDGLPWKPSRRVTQEGGQTLSLSRLLRNSITAASDSRHAVVGTNRVQAAIHHFGGVIRAKRGPFLAIPVTPAARAAGSPRRMQDLRVWQTLKGQFVLGTDDGTVHFLLRRQVTMPARPFLGVSGSDADELLEVLQRHFDGVWNRP